MKASLIITSLLFSNLLFSQNKCEKLFQEKINKEITTSYSSFNGRSIWIKGEKADKLASVLLENKRKNKFTSKVKHLRIPGVEGEVQFKIHQGRHGYNKEQLSRYFNTYKNAKNKDQLVASANETNKEGVIIYLRKNNRELILDKKESDLIIAYILELVEKG